MNAAAAKTDGLDDLFDEAFLKKLEYLHLVSRKFHRGLGRADRQTRIMGSGIEFADHRSYAPGDDLRYLDWNAYGRTERLMVRLFEEEEDLHIYFLLDTSRSMAFGGHEKLRLAFQLTAALSYVGLANLDRISIVTFDEAIRSVLPPARGKGRMFNVLRFLRGASPGGATNLEATVRDFVHRTRRTGIVVLLSDFLDPRGFDAAINLLRFNRFEPIAMKITNPADHLPDLKGDVLLRDCETGEQRPLTVSTKVLSAYQRAFNAYQKHLVEFCASKQVPLIEANITQPFEEIVLHLFRRGGFLR